MKWTTESVLNMESQLSHFVVVEDLDHDGVQDVANVSMFAGPGTASNVEGENPFRVYVDVFSGASGKKIRRAASTLPASANIEFPNIHRAQSFGSRLLVELRKKSGSGVNRVLLFDLVSGDCKWSADKVQRGRIADLGKGDSALLAWTPSTPQQSYEGGKLRAYRLEDDRSGRPWKYAYQHLQAVGDVDGDGLNDAVGSPPDKNAVNMVSGTTGRYLWTTKLVATDQHYRNTWLNPIKSDLDGDGAQDIVAGGIAMNDDRTFTPITALSGRTGEIIWRQRLDAARFRQQKILTSDLDGDGKDEVLLLARTKTKDAPRRGILDDPLLVVLPARYDGKATLVRSDSRSGPDLQSRALRFPTRSCGCE